LLAYLGLEAHKGCVPDRQDHLDGVLAVCGISTVLGRVRIGGQALLESLVLSLNMSAVQFMILSQAIIFHLGWLDGPRSSCLRFPSHAEAFQHRPDPVGPRLRPHYAIERRKGEIEREINLDSIAKGMPIHRLS
jgi:hypothetical protein